MNKVDMLRLQLNKLQKHQQILDSIITENSDTQPVLNSDLLNAKILAFITEICEFANVLRIFKYWSKKEPACKEIQLEEYVDSLHFLLSINNQLGFELICDDISPVPVTGSKHIGLLIDVIEYAIFFRDNPTRENVHTLFSKFLGLSIIFNFSPTDVYYAYIKKHHINLERQKNNY